MEEVKNGLYPYWVWVTTIVLAPFIFCTLTTITGLIQVRSFDPQIFSLWLWIVLISSIYSIPSLIIYVVVFNKIYPYRNEIIWKKLLLSAIAITGMLLSFIFFEPDLYKNPSLLSFILPLCYCISILIAGLYFKMKIIKEKAV